MLSQHRRRVTVNLNSLKTIWNIYRGGEAKMVLLTMTPAMVVAVQEYLVLGENDPSVRLKGVAGEPVPDEPAVGKPISHEQIIVVSKALLGHRSLVEGQAITKDLDPFRLHHLLRGTSLHVPPPKPKPEPVCVASRPPQSVASQRR